MSTAINNMSVFPLLKTEHLVLRQLAFTDASELVSLRSDEEVNRFLDRPKTVTLDEAEKFIANINAVMAGGEGYYWAITVKDINILIGAICLWHPEADRQRIEIGYELQPAWQGMGLMQEAMQKVMEYTFETLKFKTLIACPAGDNLKSRKLLERCGFVRDLVLEEELSKPGEVAIEVFYSMRHK
jgi:ribosomal-protein-alanine N-acetyltransferase